MFLGFLREFSFYITDWKIFKNQLENFFVVNSVSDENKKRALFLNVLDSESYKLMMTLCFPARPECTQFEKLLTLFDQEFTPNSSIVVKRLQFYQLKKDEEESVEEWAARVKNVAASCKFGEDLDGMSKKKFVDEFEDMKLWKYLEENCDSGFEDVVKKVEMAKKEYGCSCHKKLHLDYYCASWIGGLQPNFNFM